MRANIFYRNFYNPQETKLVVGGIETYILNLGNLCLANGYDTTVYQPWVSDFSETYSGLKIRGVRINRVRNEVKQLYSIANTSTFSSDINIFAADHYSFPTNNPYSISIQHGIFWDIPRGKKPVGFFDRYVNIIRQARLFWLVTKNFRNCINRVCVDYNFLNWYRALGIDDISNVWVIPNFSPLIDWEIIRNKHKNNTKVKILFARRFHDYRGTRLFSEVLDDILKNHNNVYVTFAGEGPDEVWLRNKYSSQPYVKFVNFTPEERNDIYIDHQIAIVPSLGSEGTSFAVGEAMGSGCAVLATNVGGITNMILDRYNGIMTFPSKQDMKTALEELIDDPKLRNHLSENAHRTAQQVFSSELWKKKWLDVLESVSRNSI